MRELIGRGGMGGMMERVWVIVCGMWLGGGMRGCGMVGRIRGMFVGFRDKVGSRVGGSVGWGLLLNLGSGDEYIWIIVSGKMFKDMYKKKGYEWGVLRGSREDGVRVRSGVIGWNRWGMREGRILNVGRMVYLGYSLFKLVSGLMSMLVGWMGFKIVGWVKKD